MKKRILISVILIILCFVFIGYLFRISFRKQVIYDELSAVIPARPLAYVRCSQLKSRLDQLSQSSKYRQLLQSPFVQQIKTTPWWNEFSDSFQEFLESMIIDPMRVFGADWAVGLYRAERGELLPGVILVGKIDRFAGAAERLLYLFDRFSGQIGIQFTQDVEGIPVYVLDRRDLLVPVYYSVIDDLGMISTSFPLLKNTMLQALGVTKETEQFSAFRQIVHNISDTRFVTSYVHPALLVDELHNNQFLKALKLVDARSLEAASDFPFVTISLDVYPNNKTIVRTELFSRPGINAKALEGKAEEPGAAEVDRRSGQAAEGEALQLLEKRSRTFPLIGTVHTEHLAGFMQTLESLFPRQALQLRSKEGGTFPLQWLDPPQETFGKMLECRLTGALFGTLYTVPDISCVQDVLDSKRAFTFLDTNVDTLLDEVFASAAQRALVKKSAELYQKTGITSVRMLFQDLLCYAVLNANSKHSRSVTVSGVEPVSYALLTTNTEVLKKRIDMLLASPAQSPYALGGAQQIRGKNTRDVPKNMTPQPETPVATLLIRHALLSEWLEAVSRTTTFSLLFPRQTNQKLYQILPDLLVLLKSLPPVLFELKMQEPRLSLTMQML